MPKEKEATNHPCHLLSLPSAKRFWCRHCMTVFEDAITRWRHSRLCRYGAVNNFVRRRELEAKALQNTSALNPVEARQEQSIQMCDLASTSTHSETHPDNKSQILSGSEPFTCFICHQKFASMEEMRIHVKYPCSSSKIIDSRVPHLKHATPVFIEALPGRTHDWQPPLQHEVHQVTSFVPAKKPQQNPAKMSYDIEIKSQQEMEPQYERSEVSCHHRASNTSDCISPTSIYVNEQGETVIEVKNLDLSSEGAELSLAHLLAQLSQQGIVFDETRAAELQHTGEHCKNSSTYTIIEDEEQPTAEDAANTLAQLAGLRSFSRTGETKTTHEPLVHSQAHIQNYNNSDPGTSKHSMKNAKSQIDIQYDYSYEPSVVQVNESEFAINVSPIAARKISETQVDTLSEVHKIVGDALPIKERSVTEHENESVSTAGDIQMSTEIEEFTIETVSSQEIQGIVDSKTTPFVRQTDSKIISQKDNLMSHDHPVNSKSLAFSSSPKRQKTNDNHSSHFTPDTEGKTPYPTTLYIVTSSGILPVANKKLGI